VSGVPTYGLNRRIGYGTYIKRGFIEGGRTRSIKIAIEMGPLTTARGAISGRIRRSYYLTKLYHGALYLSGSLRHQEPVIIFQAGKVGSTSVQRMLEQADLNGPVFHVHVLNAIESRYRQICKEVGLTPREYFVRSNHLEVSRYLHREIKRGLKGKKWKVITLVRDPLEQKISSFFQLIDLIVPDFQLRYRSKTLTIEVLTEIFLNRYNLERVLADWFDMQMRPVFGIDVYSSEFPKSKGYEIYHGEQADLLLIRLEDLDRCAGEAFGEFLGLTEVNLINHNRGAAKGYATAYGEFKQMVSLPGAYVNAVYESRRARHFYTEEEIKAFKAQYTR
jgi:hypothetical protein